MTVGLLAAVAGAVVYGIGSVLQAVGVRRSADRGRRVLGAAVQLTYLGGVGCDLLGWALSLVALRCLPVFVVQAVLAGSLAVTVVLAAVTIGTSLRRTDWYGIGAVMVALAVIGSAGGAQRAAPPPRAVELGLVVGLVVGVAVIGAACRWASSAAVAAMAGVAFGGGALAARAVPAAHHPAGYLGEPLAWTVVGFGVLGTFAYAFALERGDVGVATAALWVAELVVPGLLGVALLGDRVRTGWRLPAVVASIAATVAVVVLARAAARQSEHRTPVPAMPFESERL